MYDRILVGYLDTEQGRDALELGRVLAGVSHAEMLVVTASGEDGRDLAELARSGGTGAEGYDGWRPLSDGVDDSGLRVIGVGFDGSHAAREALEAAVELALPNGAALRVYTVARNYARPPTAGAGGQMPGMPTEAQALRDLLHETVAELPAEARALPVFLRGNPAAELIRATEAGVDMLVLGSRPGGPFRRALHSSISNAVMTEASCPVLICPAGVKAPQTTLA